MSVLLAAPELPALAPVFPRRVERLPSSLPRDGWIVPLAVALGLHAILLTLGFLNRHDTLLDLIAKGEVEAAAPAPPQMLEQEVILDDTPPPPPVNDPDFVKPEEARPRVAEAPKPLPKVETPPKPAPAASYAAANFVVGDKDFPQPPYPYDAKLRHYQGTVVVALNVVGGQIVGAEVASSSGYAILDTSTVQWVRQKWHFPADVTRNLTLPVKFQLVGA